MDYEKLANDIVDLVGGADNIKSVSHCMTRLRFVLKDEGVAVNHKDKIEGLDGVLGVVNAGGQYMVVLGQNLQPTFEAVTKMPGINAGGDEGGEADKPKEPWTAKRVGNEVIGFISASVSPLITGLVAGGMLKVILLLVTLAMPDFKTEQTYLLLSAIADAPFFFMPIFVAYGAANKLGATPIYAMLCSAALLHSNYTTLVSAGDAVTMFGIPVRLVSYSSQLLPALLIALVAYWCEKGFNKIVPGIFKSLLVGLCTIFVTGTLAFTILGPVGSYVGSALSAVFVFLGTYVGPLALALLTACLPWLIMCGMHMALVPFMTQAITDPGYDTLFRPAFVLHNMAEGGAALGAALRSKNPERRTEFLGISVGCILAGVSEPAIYGIDVKYKTPMYGVMAGGAAGGLVAGFLGVRAYVMGYSTILALPIFLETAGAMVVAILVAIVVACAVTMVLGIDEGPAAELPEHADDELVAVVDGTQVPLSSVSDQTFASGMLGGGVAFEPTGKTVVSPCNGTISAIFPTGHAFGVTRPDGVEVLVHIGINTVEMNGKGFEVAKDATMGAEVKAGQPIVAVDFDAVRKAGYDPVTMLIVTETAGKDMNFLPDGERKAGETVEK